MPGHDGPMSLSYLAGNSSEALNPLKRKPMAAEGEAETVSLPERREQTGSPPTAKMPSGALTDA